MRCHPIDMSHTRPRIAMDIIFVVGTPRSGTTFLQSCLLRLAGFTSVPETHFFDTLHSKRGVLSWKSKIRAASCLRKTFNIQVFPKATLRAAALDFERCARMHVERRGYSGLIEKTPAHLWYRSEISNTLPEAWFIHIVRNRYEVVRSMHAATNEYPAAWGGIRSISQCDMRWRSDVALHHRHLSLPTSLFVSYEQLRHDTEGTLRALAARLGKAVLAPSGCGVYGIINADEHWKLQDLRARSPGAAPRYSGFPTELEFSSMHPLPGEIESKYRDILRVAVRP